MDYEATKNVLTAFEREDVRYSVFGGVALNLHGLARATEDLDVFVAPERENIERLRKALEEGCHHHVDQHQGEREEEQCLSGILFSPHPILALDDLVTGG